MTTRSADETRAAGRALARRLRPGDIVLLEGPLGSGKTTFLQGVAEGLGTAVPATSPSFVIVNEYPIPLTADSSQLTASALRHVDLYRLPDPAVDADRIGLPELLADPQAITVVEWADRLSAALLPAHPHAIRVRLDHGMSDRERTIAIEA